MFRTIALSVGLLISAGSTNAFAWGCDGHRAIVFVAEQLLSTATINAVKTVLTASPVDAALKRFCDPVPSDIIADVASWADDERDVNPVTGAWHFINVPRSVGAAPSAYGKYCLNGDCIIDAIVAQFKTLKKTSVDPTRKADALRFIIHLVGDVHQPLHAITNGDRGANCLPVTYFSQAPQEDDKGNFAPNLHRVWDADLIRTLMAAQHLADARALAAYIVQHGSTTSVVAQAPTTSRVKSWARASNALARTVAYGRLPVNPPLEPAAAITLTSCDDNNHVGRRMAKLHERLADGYAQASTPVIVRQLRLAGERLAAALEAAFPAP